jgi:Lar family restriction alleviation protein
VKHEMTVENDDLKLCPFCGGRDIRVQQTTAAWISCEDCGAETDSRPNKGQARAAWNKRVGEATRSAWQPMSTAPRDRMIEVVGRYVFATTGFPRYAGFRDGRWWEFSRFDPQELVCWAWRERDEDWPREREPLPGLSMSGNTGEPPAHHRV